MTASVPKFKFRLISNRNVVQAAIFSLLFVLIPWPAINELITGSPMNDRQVYYNQIVTGNLAIDYITDVNIITIFQRELSWSGLLAASRGLGVTPDVLFGVISFIVIFSSTLLLFELSSKYLAILLINPLIITYAFSQLRLALAVALLMLLFISLKTKRAKTGHVFWVLLAGVALASIHNAVIPFALLLAIAVAPRLSNALKILLSLISAILLGIVTGPLLGQILTLFGSYRQGSYEHVVSSQVFLLIWYALALVLLIFYFRMGDPISIVGFALLLMAVLIGATGGYSSRMIAAGMPFALVSVSRLPHGVRAPLLIALGIFNAVHWMYWFEVF